MRDRAEQLTALLRAHERGGLETNWKKLDLLRTGIQLRLNPAGRNSVAAGTDTHHADRAVHRVLEAIAASGKPGMEQHATLAGQLEHHMALLLKGEWDKSKREAVSGKFGVELTAVPLPSHRPHYPHASRQQRL